MNTTAIDERGEGEGGEVMVGNGGEGRDGSGEGRGGEGRGVGVDNGNGIHITNNCSEVEDDKMQLLLLPVWYIYM